MMYLVATLFCFAFVNGNPLLDIHNHGHHAQPYKFGYSVKDHHGEQHRQEASDGAGGVVGSYGFTDDRGVARQVDYVADHAGFRAQVKTNEPGTANENPAAVHMISDAPVAHHAFDYAPALHHGALGYAEPLALHGHHGALYGAHQLAAPAYAYGAPYGGYGLGYNGYYGGALGYSGLLGGYGYGNINYGTPLLGGAVKGYDSRFANHVLL